MALAPLGRFRRLPPPAAGEGAKKVLFSTLVMPESAPPSYLYLTTTGRRTGLPREVEIWFTCLNGFYYVIAEYATSHWVQNIRANPRVAVRLESRQFAAIARVIDAHAEPELHASVRQLSSDKYGWGDGLMVELRPASRRD